MKKYLFLSDKRTFKANLHCHTNVSDGRWTPEHTKKMYMSMGYSIVAFTDHNILVNHSGLSDDDFLAINACEVELIQPPLCAQEEKGVTWTNKVYHFNLYSDDPHITRTPPAMDMDYSDIDSVNEYIRSRTEEGFLVCYNHPYWSLQTYEDYSRLKGCFAMEIYNHSAEVGDGYYGYHPQVYDEMLRCGQRLYCVSTDDNHSDTDTFGGFVMISSESLTYGEIISALKRGDFYSSQGPEIYEISVEDNRVHVRCSEVALIVMYTDGRNCGIKKGASLTEAEFTLNGNEKYIRIMCRDENHRDANSNAYWL